MRDKTASQVSVIVPAAAINFPRSILVSSRYAVRTPPPITAEIGIRAGGSLLCARFVIEHVADTGSWTCNTVGVRLDH